MHCFGLCLEDTEAWRVFPRPPTPKWLVRGDGGRGRAGALLWSLLESIQRPGGRIHVLPRRNGWFMHTCEYEREIDRRIPCSRSLAGRLHVLSLFDILFDLASFCMVFTLRFTLNLRASFFAMCEIVTSCDFANLLMNAPIILNHYLYSLC